MDGILLNDAADNVRCNLARGICFVFLLHEFHSIPHLTECAHNSFKNKYFPTKLSSKIASFQTRKIDTF